MNVFIVAAPAIDAVDSMVTTMVAVGERARLSGLPEPLMDLAGLDADD